jgi:hypothetical protein
MKLDSALTAGTASTGLGGALIAQVTQSPEVTVGAIILAVIGLIGIIANGHYKLLQDRERTGELRAELERYRALCTKQGKCPFSADGRPACAEADQITTGGGTDEQRKPQESVH